MNTKVLKFFILKLQNEVGSVSKVYAQAKTQDELLADYRNRLGLVVLSVDEPGFFVVFFLKLWLVFSPNHRLNNKVKLNFFRGLSELLEANFSLMQALKTLYLSTSNLSLKKALYFLRSEVSSGYSFSGAIGEFKFFMPHELQLIAVGESFDNVGSVIKSIVQYRSLKRKTALASLVSLVLLLLVNVLIFAGFFAFASQSHKFMVEDAWFLGYTLPPTYRAYAFIYGNEAIGYLQILGTLLGALLLWKYVLKKIAQVERLVQSMLVRIPYFGESIRLQQSLNFVMALGLAFEARVPFHRAIVFAANSVTQNYYRRQAQEISDQVSLGIDFLEVTKGKTLFKPDEFFMLKNALTSGKLLEAASDLREYGILKMESRVQISAAITKMFLVTLVFAQIILCSTALVSVYFFLFRY
jgi:type IV pilus assembly protein PilC